MADDDSDGLQTMEQKVKAVEERGKLLQVSSSYVYDKMRERTIKFDLSRTDDYKDEDDGHIIRGSDWIFKHTGKFWEELETTDDIAVPVRYSDWIVGQENAVRRIRMATRRWIEKLLYLDKLDRLKGHACSSCKKESQYIYGFEAWKAEGHAQFYLCELHFKKLSMEEQGLYMPTSGAKKSILKEIGGPYILLVSDPGMGKSLIIKILAEEMEYLYKKYNIRLYDIVSIKNRWNEYQPFVRIVPAGMARRIKDTAVKKQMRKGRVKKLAIYGLLFALIFFGLALLSSGLYLVFQSMWYYGIYEGWWRGVPFLMQWPFIIGVLLVVFPMFILVMWPMMRGQALTSGSGKTLDVPEILVDNGPGRKLAINATVANSGKMFGDVDWSAYGDTPGLSKPAHRRIVAGQIHEAHRKVLFMDEIRNLSLISAIEMLTVMEDGEAPIKGHESQGMGSHTASQNVESPPLPAVFFLVAAGNMETINDPRSVLNQLPAFRDRFRYGGIVKMDHAIDATPENEIRLAQAVTDECFKFNTPPMEKAGIQYLINHMKRNNYSKRKLAMAFRPLIQAIIVSYELALEEKARFGGEKGNILTAAYVKTALREFVKSPEEQAIEEAIELSRFHKLIKVEGAEVGRVNGLWVSKPPDGSKGAGSVASVVAVVRKVKSFRYARFAVTGVIKGEDAWVSDSVRHVTTNINRMYGINLHADYDVHIAFAESNKIDGPSAGAAMTMAVMSCLGDPRLPAAKRKPVPMRLEAAMTGGVEILTDQETGFPLVSAIGGAWEKAEGAWRWGCKFVLLPMPNYNEHVDDMLKEEAKENGMTIVGCKSILDYWTFLRADQPNEEEKKVLIEQGRMKVSA